MWKRISWDFSQIERFTTKTPSHQGRPQLFTRKEAQKTQKGKPDENLEEPSA
jgi:hypothetical protein